MENNIIKCAVFDLDGTLLNTIKTINHYLNFALSSYGLDSVSEDDCMRFVGDGAVKLIERALERVGAEQKHFAPVFKTYNDAYNASPYYLTTVYDGIPEMLSALKGRGIKLAVLSNKPDLAVRLAVENFLPEVFDIVHGGRDNIPLKPDPSALFDILSSLGVSPTEAAYIGDSEPDVLTAKNAEIALPISVTWGFRSVDQLKSAGAEIIVNTPDAITEIISC